MDRAHKRAHVKCTKCGESFTCDIAPYDAPVDVFCAWVDHLTPQAAIQDANSGAMEIDGADTANSTEIKKGGKWLGWTSPVAC